MKRMQCTFPDELAKEVKRIANEDSTSTLEAVRTLIKYGLLLRAILKDPKTKVIIRDEQGEREIVTP